MLKETAPLIEQSLLSEVWPPIDRRKGDGESNYCDGAWCDGDEAMHGGDFSDEATTTNR